MGTTTAYDELRMELGRRLGAARTWALALTEREVLCRGVQAPGDAYVTTPLAGDPIACTDLRGWGRRVREEARVLVVKNDLVGCVGCAAVRLGAHVSVEEAEEGVTLVGASRDAEGALPGLSARLSELPAVDGETSARLLAALAPREAAWRHASDVAQVVAAYALCHPRVLHVWYPGLRRDASFEVAARTLGGGFGPIVDLELVDGRRLRRVYGGEEAHAAVLALERELGGPWGTASQESPLVGP